MLDFSERQNALRADLKIMLRYSYGDNKTALADALNLVPRSLRDFINGNTVMQATTYNKVIKNLIKFDIGLEQLNVGGLIQIFTNLKSSPEELFQETFEPDKVDRLKLISYFLNGGPEGEIKKFKYLEFEEEETGFGFDKFEGLKSAMNKNYNSAIERHEALSRYTPLLLELKKDHHAYIYGYRMPKYLLDKESNETAVLLFIVGKEFSEILKKIEVANTEEGDPDLTYEEYKLCEDLSFNIENKIFKRVLINQEPALMDEPNPKNN